MSTFLKNVGFAWAGLKFFFAHERNGRLQGKIAILVIAAGVFIGLSSIEWCIILLCIAMVLGLEMINTTLERLCNMNTTDFHPSIKIIKDVAAGAVLWCSVIAAIIGLLVFLPHIGLLWHVAFSVDHP